VVGPEKQVDLSSLSIRCATTDDSWSAVTALLHRAYAIHTARGLRFHASYQDDAVTRERAREGECYLALADSQVIGTVTALRGGRMSECSWYQRPDVGSMGQLAVDPAFQHRGIGRALMDLAEERCRNWGAQHMAIDTSEHATELISLYSRRGYKLVDSIRWPQTNYKSLILAKPLSQPIDPARTAL
jgi:GNAT superfamily N-acetyltransferase